MEQLQIFNNAEFGEIRTVVVNDEPMLVGADVARALGYTDTFGALKKHVMEEDKLVCQIDSAGQKRDATVINESGLYALIFGSKLESAKRFKHWVTSEVLPSIRKNGGYLANQENLTPEQIVANALVVAQKIIAERDEQIKNLESSVRDMDRVICEMTPKVDYVDRILSSVECVTVSQIAQDYGMSAKRFNKILQNARIQHRIGEQWILYAEHQGKGYVKTKTHDFEKPNGMYGTKQLTVWTQKGRMFLYEELKKHGVLPMMEVV